MHTFQDNQKYQWRLSVTVGSLKLVRDLTGLDLLTVVETRGDVLRQLDNNPELLVDVLWALVEEQAKEQSITPAQFAGRLAGDELEAAANALIEDLILFFRPARRPALRAALGKMKEAEAAAMAWTLQKVQSTDLTGLPTELESEFLKMRESSASTPGPSPSPSSNDSATAGKEPPGKRRR